MKLFCNLIFLLFLSLTALTSNQLSISDSIESIIDKKSPALPYFQPLFNENISNISVLRGPGGIYYLTGSTGDVNGVQNGIKVWQSFDLKNWILIGTDGYVWNIDRNGKKWHQEVLLQNGTKKRAAFSPEIFYFNDTFWITYSMNNCNSSGLLRSITGSAQGPYEDISGDQPLVKGINATLFKDTDNSIWYIWDSGKARKMKPNLSGFAGTTIDLTRNSKNGNSDHIQIYYFDGRYYLLSSRWQGNGAQNGYALQREEELQLNPGSRYDCIVSTSINFFGTYRESNHYLPHAGGAMLFQDFEQKHWLTFSGYNDASAPFQCDPAILPVTIQDDGNIEIQTPLTLQPGAESSIIYVSTTGNNNGGKSWFNAFNTIPAAIQMAKPGDQIWIAQGTYTTPVEINSKTGLYIYGGFNGSETNLSMRDPQKNVVIVDGKQRIQHVFYISNSRYVRIDGITITGGKANGKNFYDQYGGGIYVLGGGETIRILNCNIEGNVSDLDGAGLYSSMGASPVLINCNIRKNGSGRNGGGIAFYGNNYNGYHLQLYNCEISGNEALNYGGAVYFDTDLKNTGLLRMINCVISKNITEQESGAIMLDRTSNLLMSNCTLASNVGIENGASTITFGVSPGHSLIENSIFYKNSGGTLTQGFGETLIQKDSKIDERWIFFRSCIFSENETNALYTRIADKRRWKTTEEINSSLGERNLSREPHFTDPQNGDYSLRVGSGAINSGSSKNAFPIDKAGKQRSISNSGESGQVDIGAFER